MNADLNPGSPQPATAPHWSLDPQDRATSLEGALWAPLSDEGVLEVRGEDAVRFLQSQCTADVAALRSDQWSLGGLCTAKGRLLAIFEAWKVDNGLCLVLPADQIDFTATHLRRFVLRARVQIHPRPDLALVGLLGHSCARVLQGAATAMPEGPWQRVTIDGGIELARLPSGPACGERLRIVGPVGPVQALRDRLLASDPRARVAGAGLWHWSGIEAALPCVHAGTRELFVPQSVHLEVLGGVSFRKGCYPGQEVVARSQYRGALRRRMALAHADQPPPGADIFHDSEPREPVGRVVASAQSPRGGVDLLFECPQALQSGGTLRAGDVQGPPLQVCALPYALFDPTA